MLAATQLRPLELARDGAELVGELLCERALGEAERVFDARAAQKPGVRLHAGREELRALLSPDGPVTSFARTKQGPNSRPVRVLLFNKRPGMNWALGFHQDRTIAVSRRREIDGFGPWSVKQGQLHVQPPHSITERMLTLRIHLDDVGAGAAPLLIIPGSHRLGRLSDADVEAVVHGSSPVACLAARGNVWAYATAIVHGSEAYGDPDGQRRVLQVDFSADDLPGDLDWALHL